MSKITKHNTENYGLVRYEDVGIINFKQLINSLSFDEYQAWASKFHYTKYFHSVHIERLHLEEEPNLDSYKIHVPVDDINQDWDRDFWYAKNPNVVKNKKRKLPISSTRKSVELWKKSLEFLAFKNNK